MDVGFYDFVGFGDIAAGEGEVVFGVRHFGSASGLSMVFVHLADSR